MGLTRLAIRRPIAILMLVMAFVVLGLLAFFKLPEEQNPNVDFGAITISTTYAGTNPQEMETLVTKPIEDSISGVSGLKQTTSSSQQGTSTINCTFFIGTDMDSAAADVRQKVDAVRKLLPTAADSPVVSKLDSTAQPVMYIAMHGGQSSRQLRMLADNIVTSRLKQATDVGSVGEAGGDVREIRVSVRRDRLAAYGITIAQLATIINNANSNISAGDIQTDNVYQAIRFLGEFANVDEIKKLRIPLPSQVATLSTGTGTTATTSTSTPRAVLLSDIADVQDSQAERTSASTFNGEPSVTLTIVKTSDGNTLNACNGVKAQLATIHKYVPSDVKFTVTTDSSLQVKDNLKDVVVSLVLGAFLAVMIVYLFLHNGRATLIIATAIPTCVLATFLPISAMGFTLNTMTLLGLSLSIGILIDDSIVVLENIVRHLQLGEDPVTAAIRGRSEIGMAAITLTAVDLVVFLPIASMGGVIGQFFRSFGAAVAIAVTCSLFISFTLTPMLASRWFHKGEEFETDGQGKRGFGAAFDRGYHKVQERYRRMLSWSLRHPWIVVLSGNAALILVVVLIAPHLGFRFAPGQDQSQVSVSIEAPAGSPLSYTTGIATEIERRIRKDSDVDKSIKSVLTSLGQSNSTGSANVGTQYASMQVALYDKAAPLDFFTKWKTSDGLPLRFEADTEVSAKIGKLVANIPGAKIQVNEVNGFGGGGAPVQVNITGQNLTQIMTAANEVKNYIGGIPGVYNPDLSFKASQPEVQIRLDRERAATYGLDLNSVASTVSASTQGDITAKYRDPDDNEQYNIRVQLSDVQKNNAYQLSQIPVGYASDGSPILLGSVANFTTGTGPSRVDHYNRMRSVTVTAYLKPGFQVGNVAAKVSPQLTKIFARPEYSSLSYVWGGETQNISDDGPFFVTALGLGILLSYMLMAALFNNMLYPLSIMLTLPQALVGALLALFITGQPLSIIAAIGIILLNALAEKNGILMVDYTNTLRSRGYKRFDALLEAAPTRLRPILMTSSAIIGATLPTALALGRGGGFRQSLGIVVVGGVFVSTLLTLFVIPCVYLLFDTFASFIARIRTRRNSGRSTYGDDDTAEPSEISKSPGAAG